MPDRAATMIHTVIVDDEQLACDELLYLLKQFPEIEIHGVGRNGMQALDLVEEFEPDLVFLDVQMPGMDGMSVIRQLRDRQASLPYFVLVTPFENYAVEAFRLEATDYLLKPVDKDRLAETIERVRRVILDRQIEPPGTPPAHKPAFQRNKVLIKSGARNFIVDAHDIIYA
ncbi:MAG: response regulator, partial [Bryobacterales bacterium]|nr:response regulator [Bryobacterales bacterium]